MASENECRQQAIWEDREAERGPRQPAPASPEAPGEPRLQAVNRQQMAWRAVDVEQLIAEDHPARAIWQLVGKLDLSSFYKTIGAVEGEAGRPALDPQLLISLWIYGYSEGVSSAREIARLCEFDPAYQWLTGLQPVNYHSLSDFRVGHREALDKLFTEVLGLLSAEGLVSLQRVMHDGTKIKACAGTDTFRREEKIRAHLEMARQQVREMGDPQNEELSQRVTKARQRAARERQERLERAEKELQELRARRSTAEAQREERVSETDPEARIMKQGGGGYAPAYNVQISTDAAQRIIVGVGVTQSASDWGQLGAGVDRIQKNLGRLPEQVVVDGGFTNREAILDMNDRGVDFIGAITDSTIQAASQFARRGIEAGFRPEAFTYHPESDTYTCPAGKVLRYERKHRETGQMHYYYRASATDCGNCEFKKSCCPANTNAGRMVIRAEEAPAVAAFRAKMATEEAKQIYRQRGGVAEFPNAWIKTKIGLRQFRLRGLAKVKMETLWACLTYNIQQWIRLCWRKPLALTTV
jgi:transposase